MFDRIASLRVSDVMAKAPITTVEPTAEMSSVARLFAQRELHSAPVVEDSGRCIGIVTASDFVQRTRSLAASEPDGLGRPMAPAEDAVMIESKSLGTVADCMTTAIQAIHPSTSLIQAARVMAEAHLHVLPVIEHDKPVGILSNIDIVAALVNAFDEARNST